ncbi:DUF4337 family protein [Pseudobacteriovorax antillogorgiicola]|uniref:DUF4337 domain-containing protein n=1 Tax=Pseudobacteriovorax antillogorgiicola TaxID=1513793 RepID=A0A1Y6B6I4_9BACT|nr:DUF4337 family protein [Pseudobacteriovorax antillogorgiicola]TCS58900.1 uncharacterized protein DUF4337 [Pseudobacteriovorax antillogorgiicola]SME93406.1 protein of unknown function [Pseudobacteriovorax antillogorgiicola]
MQTTPTPPPSGGGIWEAFFPLMIAIFASVLAINDLMADNVASLQLKLGNQRNDAFQWFQSKGIKEIVVRGQHDLLKVLVDSGSISDSKKEVLDKQLDQLNRKAKKYKMEKTEILLGSEKVGKENWIQDIDGELGKIIGAKEYDSSLEILDDAEDQFDYASMLLQISMVLGAVGMMLNKKKTKVIFFCTTIIIGVIGATFTVQAQLQSLTSPFFK